MATLNTDVLVIGTGPTGSTAALALAKAGVPVVIINRYGWTCRTPRAHITNPRTMEILSDLGVMEGVRAFATPNDQIADTIFCRTLVGEEYGRLRVFGTHPDRRAIYAAASPETTVDLPQNYLENILLGSAAHHGAKILLHTEFICFEQDEDGVTAHVVNRLTQHEFTIHARYLIGADGSNSRVARQAELPIEGEEAKMGATNILFDADLGAYVAHRPCGLFWTLQDAYGGGFPFVLRMIRPWTRWIVHSPWPLDRNSKELDKALATSIVHDLLGDDSIPIDIDSLSIWAVNTQWATRIQAGRVFCAGDAIHRHSPLRGLGSNTCIQDAYNLAWKLVHVIKGWAAPSLLDTYNSERSPVGEQVVKSVAAAGEYFVPPVVALTEASQMAPSDEHLPKEVLHDHSSESVEIRTRLREGIRAANRLYDMPGLEMNHRYQSAAVIHPSGESMPSFEQDALLYYQPTTFPGARLPHGWVVKNGRQESLLCICGGGCFTLLTGNSGEPWREAARRVENELGVPINVILIGPGQDYDDPYGDYARLCEVTESGAILVRPDMHVGWRAVCWQTSSARDLKRAMAAILGRNVDDANGVLHKSDDRSHEKFDDMQLADLR